MLKLKMIAFLILTVFCTAGFSEEGEPIRLFQIDFDLTADSAFELVSSRFNCSSLKYQLNGLNLPAGEKWCSLNKALMAVVGSKGNSLAFVKFHCMVFNGCGYSSEELKKSLSDQKLLVFEELCATGTLGEQVCVYGEYDDLFIMMKRAKFRAKNLSFD